MTGENPPHKEESGAPPREPEPTPEESEWGIEPDEPVPEAPFDSVDAGAASEEDEFAFTRERVADADDWALEKDEAPAEASAPPAELAPDEAKAARVFQILFHMGAAGAAVLTLTAAVFHFARVGPGWVEPVYVFFATGLVLLAAFAFPHARFAEARVWDLKRLAARRAHHTFVLRVFGILFSVGFIILFLVELAALAVGILNVELPARSLLLARHFVLVPVFVIAALVAALYVRKNVPSKLPKERFEEQIVAAAAGIFAFAATLAVFFSIELPAVAAATGIEARHAVYFAGLGLMAAIAVVNLRLRIPNVVRIAREEIQLAREVDRPRAQLLQRRMMRNYLLAVIFVVGSVAFLGFRLAGLVRPADTGGLDVVLLVYLGVGLVFLGIVALHFVQAKSIGQRVVVSASGTGPGKRRYRPDEIQRFTVLAVTGFIAFILLVLMLLVSFGAMSSIGPIDLIPSNGTDFFVFAALFGVGPFAFYWARETRRVRGIDDKFPDFLRDLAESQRAGMTLPRALLTSSKGVYGPLTKEIKIMAAQVEWGVSFTEALTRFSERTRTPLISRTVSLINEAAASGGNVVDILTAASDDARDIKNIIIERKQSMAVYSMIVYIAFGVFLVVIMVLNSQFIPELAAATAATGGGSVGGIQFGQIDVAVYQRIFFHAALIQGIGGGLVSGVMADGHPFAGLKHAIIMMLIAYVAFRLLIT